MRLIVTGDAVFLARYAPLWRALEPHVGVVNPLPSGNLAEWLPVRLYNRLTRGTPLHDRLLPPDPHPATFVLRSRQTERKLARRAADMVLHVFCTFAPTLTTGAPPYTMYLDYTMAQAHREYPPWAAFRSARARRRWMELERAAYHGARYLFAMSDAAQASLVADYGVQPDRVSVVGNAGQFDCLYTGRKAFGTHRLLFDGSDFFRKGGDILLEALPEIRRLIPDTTLTVIGTHLSRPPEGVINPGRIVDRRALQDLFLSADLVVSAARCDPFPGFVIEGMNHGVPCVLSRTNGLADLVQTHGAGVVVEELAARRYATAIASLLSQRDRLADMSRSARRLVADRLNWDRIAAIMGPVLRRCAKTPG